METTVQGQVVRGLRAASGASRILRRGTIKLQLPHFRAAIPGFDDLFDGPVHVGTLNIKVTHRQVRVRRPAFHVVDVRWEHGQRENFYLSPCTLAYSGRRYRGLLYIPDPATKPQGLPVGQYLEVLTSRIAFIRYGARVQMSFPSDAVELFVPRRAGPPPALTKRACSSRPGCRGRRHPWKRGTAIR